MPQDVVDALRSSNVITDYDGRPSYQRNDYLGWIASAKADATRQKRIAQMIDELRTGGVYMGMNHEPSRKG